MKSIICTLFEGHYHLGAAALINSLHIHGFRGDICCGFRGEKPVWASTSKSTLPGIEIHWIQLETKSHLTNYKPTFIKKCVAELASEPKDLIFYMDPDLVIKSDWLVFERWATEGIAIVEDINPNMPLGHPYRLRWHDLYATKQLKPARAMQRYHNAGFIGLQASEMEFVSLWERIIGWSVEVNGAVNNLKHAKPHDLFHSQDQDALNMALELSETPLHTAGPEAMDFTPGGHLISHAAGRNKPWRGGFLLEALKARPPGQAHKCYYDYAEQPIRAMPAWLCSWRRIELKVAGLIGRFYRRS